MRKIDLPSVVLFSVIGAAAGIFVIVLVISLDGILALRWFVGFIGLSLPVIVSLFLVEQSITRDREQKAEKLESQQKQLDIINQAGKLRLTQQKFDEQSEVNEQALSDAVDASLTKVRAVNVKMMPKAAVYPLTGPDRE